MRAHSEHTRYDDPFPIQPFWWRVLFMEYTSFSLNRTITRVREKKQIIIEYIIKKQERNTFENHASFSAIKIYSCMK